MRHYFVLSSKTFRRMLATSLGAGMVFGSLPPGWSAAAEDGSAALNASVADAAATAVSVYESPSIGKVSLGANSGSMELKDVTRLGRTVRFTVAVTNAGSTDLDFIDYWVRLRSVSGSQFSIKLIEKDQDKSTIAPKSTETFTFYATVNENTALSDLIFEFIVWDFSQPSFERSLGTVRIPASYNPVTPEGAVRKLSVEDVPAHAWIKRVNSAVTSDKRSVSLTFVTKNVGTKPFSLPSYQFSIRTKDGLTYPLKISGLDDNETLSPQFEKEITLKGELPAGVSTDGWELVLSETEGEPAVVLPLASFRIPASTGDNGLSGVPVGEATDIVVDDQTIETRIVQTIRNANDKNYLTTIRFSFLNKGTEPVRLPEYLFKIRTSTDLTYPVTASLNDIRLDPLVEKEVELKATIPNTVPETGWKLLMEEPVEDNATSGDTAAVFDIPDDSAASLTVGTAYSYTNDNGTYLITFTGVQRLPWEDQDVLSAEFTIQNNDSDTLPVPSLQGRFLLDDTIEVNAVAYRKDALVALRPGQSVHVSLYGKIPYTYEYDSIQAILEEKRDEETTVQVAEFTAGSAVTAVRVLEPGTVHTIAGAGRRASVSMRSVRTYEGIDGGNLFTVLVDVKNLEPRAVGVLPLVGHLKTPDGLLFPVRFEEYTGKVAPSATATLLASATLPSSVSTDNLQLVLGEGISGQAGDGEGTAIDAYTNAVAFKLPKEEGVKRNAAELSLFPYTVTLRNIQARLDSVDTFVFSFDYELTKNSFIQNADNFNHQLVIEFLDDNGSELFSRTFTLGTQKAEDDDNQLKLGKGKKYFEVKDDSTVNLLMQYNDDFYIMVYDEFNGVRKLLAQIPYNWYSR